MRPPFKNGGGKKGMRQVTGKHQKKVILRPAPAPNNVTSSKENADATDEDDGDGASDLDEEDDTEQYGYRQSLQQERLPLTGLSISVSGCSGQKQDLLKMAQEYGAEVNAGLREDTTHLVTDQRTGAKYKIALERRMNIMLPTWLPAVREAWTSGESVDFEEIESEHRAKPLAGVVFTMTHFAQGHHKEEFRELLIDAGASYTARLDHSASHLIVASPSSPHSQTKPSDKLLHALRNRQRLHPDFKVVWEGWAREAIKFGGRREARDDAWVYEEGKAEPDEDLSWTITSDRRPSTIPPREGPSAVAATTTVPHRTGPQNSRDLTGGGAAPARKFSGYDSSLTDAVEDEQARRAATIHDLANGKILKKRKRTNIGPDASQGNPEQLFDVFGQIVAPTHALEPHGTVETTPAIAEPADVDSGEAGLPVPPPGYRDEEMVYEMRDGEVGLQRTKKSKSAIKAITSKRSIAEVDTAPKTIAQLRSGEAAEARRDQGGNDDSGFLDNTDASMSKHDEEAPAPCSSDSTQSNGVPADIFAGHSFAIMDVKARDPSIIASYVAKGGGHAIVDASDRDLERVDWIIVDYVEPPERFANSEDPRVVSVCWIEMCIWEERVVPVADRILDRPIPYPCPVNGAEKLLVHFSGWSSDDGPFMHHNRRFLHAVGVPLSTTFSRACTHLILHELEENPSLSASQIDANDNRKVLKAREWGKEVVSMRDFRQVVQQLAASAPRRDELMEAERGSEIPNGRRRLNETTHGAEGAGPLKECVVYFSTKSNIDRQTLANIVKDLGGTAVKQYSDAVTHFVYSDPAQSASSSGAGKKKQAAGGSSRPFEASYKDFKLAKASPHCLIVHPRWIEECGRASSKVSELDFPYTFHSRKGGQLFELGMGMIASPSTSPPASRRVSPGSNNIDDRPAADRVETTSTSRKRSQPNSDRTSSATEERAPGKGSEGGENLVVDDLGAVGGVRRSPSPRRRRSDSSSARTEVAAEDDEQGGEEARSPVDRDHGQSEAHDRPGVAQASNPAASAAAPTATTSGRSNELDEDDHSTIHALSEVPPRQTDEVAHEQRQLAERERRERLLKEQTDRLRQEMQIDTTTTNGPGGGIGGAAGPRTKANLFGRKQQSIPQLGGRSPKKYTSPTRTTSLPALLPSSSSSPSRDDGAHLPPHGAFPSSSFTQSQAGAHDSSMRVVFDEPQAIEARKRILQRQKEAAEAKEREERQRLEESAETQRAGAGAGSRTRRVTRSAKKGMY